MIWHEKCLHKGEQGLTDNGDNFVGITDEVDPFLFCFLRSNLNDTFFDMTVGHIEDIIMGEFLLVSVFFLNALREIALGTPLRAGVPLPETPPPHTGGC